MRRHIKVCFCFKIKLAILFIINSIQLYSAVPVFNHFGQKQGLNESSVKSITQDHNGFIWVGTQQGLFFFDGISFVQKELEQIEKQIDINSLLVDDSNNLWIGTRNNGLLKYSNNVFTQIDTNEGTVSAVYDIIKDSDNKIWLATNNGVYSASSENSIMQIPEFSALDALKGKKISAIEKFKAGQIIIAQADNYYVFNVGDNSLLQVPLNKSVTVHDLFVDTNNNLWLATSNQILRYDLQTSRELAVPELKNALRILTVSQFEDSLWVATINGGVFQIDINSLETQQFTYHKQQKHSISDKNVMTLFISKDGYLWTGGFSEGMNSVKISSLKFGFETNVSNSFGCSHSPKIYSLTLKPDKNILLGSDNALVRFNPKTKECIGIETHEDEVEYQVYSSRVDDEIIWISSSIGLLKYNQLTNTTENIFQEKNITSFFSHELANNNVLVGTAYGLYQYDVSNSKLSQLEVPNHKNISYIKYTLGKNGDLLLPNGQGLLVLTAFGEFVTTNEYMPSLNGKDVLDIKFNSLSEVFVSIRNEGVYHFDRNQQLIYHYSQSELLTNSTSVYQILIDEENDSLWLGSDKGIIYIDIKTKSAQLFKGNSEENYLSLFSYSLIDEDGKFYFAGNSGYISFYPQDIDINPIESRIVINQLKIMNQVVNFGEVTSTGFVLNKQIENNSNLEFSHKDKIFGIDFIKLNYQNPTSVKYRYKLLPISSNWILLNNGERSISFTNLKAGDYKINLQATDNNGVWPEDSTVLTFKVKPAPWLTWWAFLIYIILVIGVIYFYFKNKIKTEKKINEYLNTQVDQQTQHIKTQNQKLEELITRKNEIFSNVSHEFRTPLTLILGPINELQNIERDSIKKDKFEMVSRNAKRLLNLVNQMLKLSQVAETDKWEKETINLATRLKVVIEPYVYLANKKDINIEIENLSELEVLVTEEAIETSIGNFLSNAIKYTDEGGKISVGTIENNNRIQIYVKDTGCGITEEDKSKVFKRFSRLDQHESIQGIGIGLALVKEIAELNDADLEVESVVNEGSIFSISLPIYNRIINQLVPLNLETAASVESSNHGIKPTVLIIDDNDDMRAYIHSVLENKFKCLLAVDGQDGIEKAFKYIPDIIVCDVMMPKFDGFQVSRKLRGEMMTSHIPLVLLTALDEKTSRIKGWRENIDMYLNKPFDAEELKIQLTNILKIRSILTHNQKQANLNEPQVQLSELDQKFIQKLKSVIENEFADPTFNLEKIASQMFVSDRQLQRKTRALINKSPMDFIRETRLNKAALSLEKGYSISITSDTCGFSSVSYFSQVFKRYFGISPKEYQNNKQNI